MKPKPKLNVAYASNDSFAMQTGISLLSLLANNGDLDVCAYIMANGISDENKKRLEGIAKGKAELHLIDISEFLNGKAKEYGIASYADSFDAYSRIWIVELLPDSMSTILYIDGDTVINGSLKELAQTDIRGYSCAMAKDIRSEKFNKKINLENIYEYFNSGVILINLDFWKEYRIGDALLNDILNFPTIYPDNAALCRVLKGKIKTLPLTCNATPMLRLYNNKSVYGIAFRSNAPFCPEQELNEARENPAILHYTNYYLSGRPWFKDCIDKKGLQVWRKYLADSPWATSFSPRNQHRPLKSACIKFLRILYRILPEGMFVAIVVKMFEKVARPIFGIANRVGAKCPPPPPIYSIYNRVYILYIVYIHKTLSIYPNVIFTDRSSVPVVRTATHIAEKRRVFKRFAPVVFTAVDKPLSRTHRRGLGMTPAGAACKSEKNLTKGQI
jgi:lipopolysaccharide biosynthesis glycosyltransferase